MGAADYSKAHTLAQGEKVRAGWSVGLHAFGLRGYHKTPMRPLIRRTLLACSVAYLALSLPLVLLLLRSEYFRSVTSAEVTRKLSHLRPMEAVFCVDSITATVPDWADRLGLPPFSTLNLAIPGAYVQQVLDQVRRALHLRTRRVVVMAGTNDLGDSRRTDDAILADWERILHLVPGGVPPRRIVVSIPLQGDSGLDARITGLNRRLEAAAVGAGWIFLDLDAPFRAAREPRGELFSDGQHFSELAYRIWFGELARVLGADD